MRLSHLHLPGLITYTRSLQLQEALLEKHFAYKTYLRKSTPAVPAVHAPNPTLLTFQTHPTYTVGRRHLNANPLSPSQIAFLTTNSQNPYPSSSSSNLQHVTETSQLATFYPSPRGGLLTYHAPGQLTAYLILNLRTHNLTPRCYIRTLENAVTRTCARHGVPNTGTTENPGVWVTQRPNLKVINGQPQTADAACKPTSMNDGSPEQTEDEEKEAQSLSPTDRKICAVGVQVSRGITSHGIGLNVYDAPILTTDDGIPRDLYTLPSTNLESGGDDESRYSASHNHLAPGYLSWGFSRIVACGLEGKSVTWLSREAQQAGQTSLQVEDVAHSLAIELCQSLGLDERDIESVTEEQVLDSGANAH